MATRSIFNEVPIEVPNKSGFDCSHKNLITGKCGTLYPVLVDPLLPGDEVSLGERSQFQLPPMATDFYGRLSVKYEAFFVPYRVIYGGWKNCVQTLPNGQISWNRNVSKSYLPLLTSGGAVSYNFKNTLADYLGTKRFASSTEAGTPAISAMPFLAYHKIWDDHYRDKRLQLPIFTPVISPLQSESNSRSASVMPYITLSAGTENGTLNHLSRVVGPFNDSSTLNQFRQRNWSKDYFTNSTYEPQAGEAASVELSLPVVDGSANGGFTISALRSANSLQMFRERNNLGGTGDYQDIILAQYGVRPADAVVNKSLYLGSRSFDVYTKGVFQSSQNSDNPGNNPFDSIGSKYGSSMAVSEDSLIDHFEAKEHGFLMVLCSLVPERIYSTGIRRYLLETEIEDIPFPILAGVGDQEIYDCELGERVNDAVGVFGWTQRYAHYKWYPDEVHGELSDDSSLSSFALQSSFPEAPELGSDFIAIPQNYLGQVKSVTDADDTSAWYVDFWADIYFTYKKRSTLPAYSLPTLENPKHTHTIVVPNGGKRL